MLARSLLRTAPALPRTTAAGFARSTARSLHLRATPRLQAGASQGEHTAHTATGRIAYWAKNLPVEIYPLFVIMGGSLGFGLYSFFKVGFTDRTLRLARSGGQQHHQDQQHQAHW